MTRGGEYCHCCGAEMDGRSYCGCCGAKVGHVTRIPDNPEPVLWEFSKVMHGSRISEHPELSEGTNTRAGAAGDSEPEAVVLDSTATVRPAGPRVRWSYRLVLFALMLIAMEVAVCGGAFVYMHRYLVRPFNKYDIIVGANGVERVPVTDQRRTVAVNESEQDARERGLYLIPFRVLPPLVLLLTILLFWSAARRTVPRRLDTTLVKRWTQDVKDD